jgi:hypothetical protein
VNIWLGVGAVIVLLLIAVFVVQGRRPHSAEVELGQPKIRPARVGSPGSLDPSSLRDWLLSAKDERRTGTLQLTAGSQTCSLYFLFGHLFHVATGTLTGEPALQECLTWQDIHYTFDATAKMPTEETIERPIDQILA